MNRFIFYLFFFFFGCFKVHGQLFIDITSDKFNKSYFEENPKVTRFNGEKSLAKLLEKGDRETIKGIAFYKAHNEIETFNKHRNYGFLKGESFKWFEACAALGDMECQYYTGIHYLVSYGVESDLPKSLELIEDAYNKGFDCPSTLGMLYYAGIGTEKDEERGAKLLLGASELLQPLENYTIGNVYMQGEYVDKDPLMALHYWFKGITFYEARRDIINLLQTSYRPLVINELKEYDKNYKSKFLKPWYREYLNKEDSIPPEVYCNYATIVFDTDYGRFGSMEKNSERAQALKLWEKYSPQLDSIPAEQLFFYGLNMYDHWNLRETNKVKEGIECMEKAAKMNKKYAAQLAHTYETIGNVNWLDNSRLEYWRAIAATYSSNPKAEIITQIARLFLDQEDLGGAYNLTQKALRSGSTSPRDHPNLLYIRLQLCPHVDDCKNRLFQEYDSHYEEYTHCSDSGGKGYVVCDNCQGKGYLYDTFSAYCKICGGGVTRGTGRLNCPKKRNLPDKYVVSVINSIK